MDRLNAMGQEPDPLVIVPATPDRGYDDLGGPATMPMAPVTEPFIPAPRSAVVVNEPSVIESVVPVQTIPTVPRLIEAPLPYPRRRDWGPVLAAGFVALIVGGIVGFLIGRNGKDDNSTLVTSNSDPAVSVVPSSDQAAVDAALDGVFTVLLAQAEQSGSVVLPTPYPKLDQLLAFRATGTQESIAAAESTVSAAADDRAQLADQVTMLQAQATTLQADLAAAEQARDDLQSQLDAGGSNADTTAAQIKDLQAALTTTQADLDTANQNLATAQSDLADATAQLDKLGVGPVENLVGRPIADVRNIAKSNGWLLVERPVDGKGSTIDTVTIQQPSGGSTMIKGSVLYVEVAAVVK
ncbi:MAG: PASTA domain-containing protein [Ilumatobacteraceae bacterium]